MFTFLGTGTSVGIPMVACDCATCTSSNTRNHRYRCSVLIRTADGNILIDTPPELRLQLLREKVTRIHAVLLTHYHADHLFGLDDIRPFGKFLQHPLPLYCTEEVEERVRTVFAYAFGPNIEKMPPGTVPRMTVQRFENHPFPVLRETITPIRLEHAHFTVHGFRIGDLAYCTDVNRIPEESWGLLKGLRVLILDALRPKPHPAHFGLEEALDVIRQLKPERAYLTHLGHELEHEATSARLPPNVQVAWDGLSFPF